MPATSTIRSSAAILFCLLVAYALPAQENIRLNFRHISPKAGLSSIFVRRIIQDPYGFMWVGTEDGLNCYDGRNFTVYNKGLAGRHSLTGEDTRDLLPDTLHHLIWEITSFGGIDAIDYLTGNTVYSYRQSDDRNTADIVFNSLALEGDRLFIGSTNGLYILNIGGRHLNKAPLLNSMQQGTALAIDNILKDRSGHLWLFCRDQGLLVLKDSSLTVLGILPGVQLNGTAAGIQFYDCSLLQDGAILSATSAGLRIFSIGPDGKINVRNDPFPGIDLSRGRDIYSCRQDKKGYIWFSTAGYLVRATASGNAFNLVKEHTSREASSWLDAVYSICFDKEDNVWLGCQAGLAFAQNSPSCFTSITSSALSETTIHHTYYLNPVNDSTLYCCAQEGLYKVNAVKGIVLALDKGPPYYQAFSDPHGRLLVSSINGMYILRNGHKIPLAAIYPEFRQLGKQPINSHCYSGDSLLVFGTRNRGIIVWNYRLGSIRIIDRHTPDIWLKDNYVCNVYTDHRGLVWILGYKSVSLLDFAHHTIRSVATYDPRRNTFYSLLFDICEANGRYYLASYGAGVLILDADYRLTGVLSVKDGLSANSVYKVIPYKDSLLFVTSNHGLSVIDIHNHYTCRNYYESDGLHSDNFEEYSGAIRNNIIYVGGANGITAIDPALFTTPSPPPPVYVRQVRTEARTGHRDTADLRLSSLEIPNDALQTTVYFSSINYQNPDRSHLAYRIKELKGGWIDIGAQDFVPLIGLNPGEYTLQVRAANKDGVWNNRPTELALRFLPKWYQTLWFKLLVIVTIGGLLYAFYLYRIRQLQMQQKIRKDIASDLHDDIGSTLNTVKIFTHLAKREQQKEEYLTRIEESLTQASAGLRDMIWVLDDSEDTVRELGDRIRKFTLPVAQANDIHFECTLADEVAGKVVAKTVKRNLLLIAKEAINNSLKYSGCHSIYVSIGLANDKLLFAIRDDGQGFDTEYPAPGNGLRNIRQRARQIGFHAQITSSPHGTLIEITG